MVNGYSFITRTVNAFVTHFVMVYTRPETNFATRIEFSTPHKISLRGSTPRIYSNTPLHDYNPRLQSMTPLHKIHGAACTAWFVSESDLFKKHIVGFLVTRLKCSCATLGREFYDRQGSHFDFLIKHILKQ